MKVLYFAWLRTKVGVPEEDVDPPGTVATVGDLAEWLATRSEAHRAAFSVPGVVKASVNQEFAGAGHPVRPGDEVGFFPPVTGG